MMNDSEPARAELDLDAIEATLNEDVELSEIYLEEFPGSLNCLTEDNYDDWDKETLIEQIEGLKTDSLIIYQNYMDVRKAGTALIAELRAARTMLDDFLADDAEEKAMTHAWTHNELAAVKAILDDGTEPHAEVMQHSEVARKVLALRAERDEARAEVVKWKQVVDAWEGSCYAQLLEENEVYSERIKAITHERNVLQQRADKAEAEIHEAYRQGVADGDYAPDCST